MSLLGMACVAEAAAPITDDSHPTCNLDIERQPLDGVLQQIARQCGVQVVYFSQVTEGLTASALKGPYTIDDALRRVLDHTGLTFRKLDDNTVEIQVAAAKVPEGATASADSERGASRNGTRRSTADTTQLPEVIVSDTAEGLVATRVQTPLNKIPQTISIISTEQMRQQNNTTLADALVDAVGITAAQVDSASQVFYSRGFQITTYHLDGGASLHDFSDLGPYGGGALFLSPDLGEFDHIEVLRGADALFGANGNPGATVNLVRKRPLEQFSVMVDSSAGSWHNYREEADVTGPLAFDGALRGRLDADYTHRGYFYSAASLERKNVFAAIEYDLTSRTLLTLGGSYDWEYAQPFEGGLPAFSDGSDAHFPRSTSFTFNWERQHTQMREMYIRLEQKLGAAWRLKVDATSLNGSTDYTLGQFFSPVSAMTGSLSAPPFARYTAAPALQKQTTANVTLTGKADWFGHGEEIALGGDYTLFRQSELLQDLSSFGPPVPDAYDYSSAAYPDPRLIPNVVDSAVTTHAVQVGAFASLLAQISDPWSVTVGLRDSSERTVNTSVAYIFGLPLSLTSPPYAYGGKLTPFLGTVYALTHQYSLYASYADIYDSNNGNAAVGSRLPPADGIDIEAGIKAAWRDGALAGSLAGYSIVQRGLAAYDFNSPETDRGGYCCYLPNGRNKSRGFDAELHGAILPGWLVSAGYTFNDNKSEIPGSLSGEPLSSQTPRHLLKIWTSEQLPGAWHRWTIGGTLQAQSANLTAEYICSNVDQEGNCIYQTIKDVQGGYMLVSPRVGYQFDAHWNVALSVNNVFDRVYYQTIGLPQGGNWYGDPRNFLFRLAGRF